MAILHTAPPALVPATNEIQECLPALLLVVQSSTVTSEVRTEREFCLKAAPLLCGGVGEVADPQPSISPAGEFSDFTLDPATGTDSENPPPMPIATI